MIAVLDRDPKTIIKTIAEIFSFIAEHQNGYIRKKYGLTHEELETLMTLALPAMKWSTKYPSMKVKQKEEAKKEANNEPAA